MNTTVAQSLLLALILSMSTAHAAEWSKDGWERAYARRNYQLGMTLTDFRATTFPDLKYSPNAYAVCSNDIARGDYRYSYSVLLGDLVGTGVIKCHYYFMNALIQRLDSAQLLAAEWGLPTDFYFVKPEGADDYFLYHIVSTSKAPIFSELLKAYTVALGSEPKLVTSTLQNRFGASFPNVVATWDNAVSTLKLHQYYSDLDTLAIELTLTPLVSIVEKRKLAVARERASKL